jgi:membrane protein
MLRLGPRLRSLRELLGYYLKGLYRRTDEHHVFLVAGGVAFSLIFCMIPMLLVIFSALGFVLERPSIVEQIDIFIDRAIPYEAYAEFVKQATLSRVEEFRDYKGQAGVVGTIWLLFASSLLFGAMRTVLNTIYQVKSEESFFMSKLRDLGLILIVLCFFLVSTTVLPGLEILTEFAHKIDALSGISFGFVEKLTAQTVSFFIILTTFIIIYSLVPHQRVSLKTVLVSSISAAVLWFVAKELFGFYITNFVTLKQVYGAYTLLIATALWIYYTSLVFMTGAEIGQLSRERTQGYVRKGRLKTTFFPEP